MTRRGTEKLNPGFFTQDTVEVARGLLGMELVTRVRGAETSGMIVEVEAYHGATDEAAHCFRGRTKRNEVMFWEGGFCYVYFIYGMYHCVNVVTENKDVGAAVLIRAVQPLAGVETMKRRRALEKSSREQSLTSGPGKLCQALAIDRRMWGEHFLRSQKIELRPYASIPSRDVHAGVRVGISKSKDLKWRFFLKNNPWVSK